MKRFALSKRRNIYPTLLESFLFQITPENGDFVRLALNVNAITLALEESISSDLDQRAVAIPSASPSHHGVLKFARALRPKADELAFSAPFCHMGSYTIFTNFASKPRALRNSRTVFSNTTSEALWYLRQKLVAHMSLRMMHCNVISALWQLTSA